MKFKQVATALGPKTSQKEFAQAVEVVPRTLRNWKKRERSEDFPKLGRPAHDERAYRNAFWRVGREYLRQGRCGWRPIENTIGETVPTRLIQAALRRLKSHEEKHNRRRILRSQVRMEVLTKNTLWVQDSAQVAQTPEAEKVDSQIVKDRGPCTTVGVSTGGPTTGPDVIAMLEKLRTTRGLPLVLGTDRGSPFVCQEVEAYLRKYQVIHLLSLPRTPQHNGAAEVGIGELKRCARLGAAVIASPDQAHAAIIRAAILLNNNRRRGSKGFKTGAELDERMVAGYHIVERARFYDECCQAIKQVRQSGLSYRAMQMAERGVIFGKLENYGLIKRYRGGSQTHAKAENIL